MFLKTLNNFFVYVPCNYSTRSQALDMHPFKLHKKSHCRLQQQILLSPARITEARVWIQRIKTNGGKLSFAHHGYQMACLDT